MLADTTTSQSAPPPHRPARLRLLATRLLALCILLIYLGLLIAHLPDEWTAAHPVCLPLIWLAFFLRTYFVPLACLLALILAIAALRRRWPFVLALTPLVLYALTVHAATYVPRRPAPTGPTLRVLSFNAMGNNHAAASLPAFVDEHDPDVLCIQEYSQRVHAACGSALAARFPHAVFSPTAGLRGTAVYSRLPFASPPERFTLAPNNDPQYRVVLDWAGHPVVLHCIHLPPPSSPKRFADQRLGFATLRSVLDLDFALPEPSLKPAAAPTASSAPAATSAALPILAAVPTASSAPPPTPSSVAPAVSPPSPTARPTDMSSGSPARALASAPPPPLLIVCGDFNQPNDSPAGDWFARRGLLDATLITGAGPQPTWCYRGRRAILPKVRIDHVYLSPALSVHRIETLPVPGSDHRATLAEVGLTPPPASRPPT